MQKCGVQKKCGGERKRRRSYAEVAEGNTGANAEDAEVTQKSQKGIPDLFEKG